jgi:hypothetical protein
MLEIAIAIAGALVLLCIAYLLLILAVRIVVVWWPVILLGLLALVLIK